MKLPPLPLLVLDTETTGFVPRTHRVIEFACVKLEGGKKVAEYEQLINIDDDIPPHVRVLTAIKDEDLIGMPTFADILPTIAQFVSPETIIVGQNTLFDIGMLRGEGWDLTAQPWIDTAMLASIVFPEHLSYSLGYLSDVLKLNHEPKHRALGDVHATLELLERCYERLSELTPEMNEEIQKIAVRGPEGYSRFFESIAAKGKAKPVWLKRKRPSSFEVPNSSKIKWPTEKPGTVQLLEESLHPLCLASVMESVKNLPGTQVIAVKNLDATLRKYAMPKDVMIVQPAVALLDPASATQFLDQQIFTTDELTLAIKLKMYEPKVKAELPIHGNEYAVWDGKLKCSAESALYQKQFAKKEGVMLTSHEQMLSLVMEEKHLSKNAHIIIDDASMLEDTATNALGWTCGLNALRAASEGHEFLTQFTDLLVLWAEKTRSGVDTRYIMEADLLMREAEGLKEQLALVLATDIPEQAQNLLRDVQNILNPENLPDRIAFIEHYSGSITLKSVPANIAKMLKDTLYQRHRVSLIVPPGSSGDLKSVVPEEPETKTRTMQEEDADLTCSINLSFPPLKPMGEVLKGITGKTVILLSSKRSIEDVFVKYFEQMEARGVTMLCQGMSGGQSRMQAEFASAAKPAILLTTPWTFETYELPPSTVDTLLIHCLPFDHPSHAVFSRRAQRYKDPFNDYSLPRLLHRLFRLLRTFCKHKAAGATVEVSDDRLLSKSYGKEVREYLLRFVEGKVEKKTGTEQLKLL